MTSPCPFCGRLHDVDRVKELLGDGPGVLHCVCENYLRIEGDAIVALSPADHFKIEFQMTGVLEWNSRVRRILRRVGK
jgi:hypothetical protein